MRRRQRRLGVGNLGWTSAGTEFAMVVEWRQLIEAARPAAH
jgi:hypothetical protein